MCSRKVVVKPLIFRLFRTLPVSQRLRFLCLIIMACETSGIKLQGPSLCIRTHGWKFLSKKVDRLLTKNPLSETNVEFGFFVSSFLGQLFCFRISPCWSQHRLGPCSFIPVGGCCSCQVICNCSYQRHGTFLSFYPFTYEPFTKGIRHPFCEPLLLPCYHF